MPFFHVCNSFEFSSLILNIQGSQDDLPVSSEIMLQPKALGFNLKIANLAIVTELGHFVRRRADKMVFQRFHIVIQQDIALLTKYTCVVICGSFFY